MSILWSGLWALRWLLTGCVTVVVLLAWVRAVGPQLHVVETVLGLALALAAGAGSHLWLRTRWRVAGRP